MQPHHHPQPYPVSLQVRARSQTEQDCICRAPCTTSADIIIINKCKSSPTRGGGRARWRTTIYGMSSSRSSSRAGGGGSGERGSRDGCMCVRMRLLASECETGINMWHPDDDQSAAADMTAKRRNGAPSGYASSMCEREGKGEGAGVWQRKVAMLCSLAF